MTLPAASPELRVAVVVPAKDEERRIGACLDALAGQVGVGASEYEVLVVLDGCSDATAEVVAGRRARHPDLALHVLDGPDRGVGAARKLGMDVACRRLASVCGPGALIASTDADSVVAPDWLSAQLLLVEGGAGAIGGRIELAGGGSDLPKHVLDWYEEQSRRRYARVISTGPETPQEHWQFSGASMSVTVEVYRRVGGLQGVRYLEDEHFEQTLEEAGVGIFRSSSVRVTTSTRTTGRAERGLATDLFRVVNGAACDAGAPPDASREEPDVKTRIRSG
ncbi:glycosyltransferase [Rubrobacter indicoceani]|uniref:glycosyltransferase n=1 Tax=Rubrobacter indicoceani TaxID=2051957 RepID=UPI0013C4FDC2|nr:glycosyltransferase family A protein [Rubrobacter indicoceani]